MSSGERNRIGRLAGLLLSMGIGSLLSLTATAQLAPTGDHYVGRTSDAEYQGAVSGTGGYSTSVPLDLPPEHGGIPVPVQVVYTGGNGGAAGVGWQVPISFIRVRSTFAWRRPVPTPGVAPVAPERVLLSLNGSSTDLVLSGTTYLPRESAPVLNVVKQDANTWVAYDGVGRTYTFSTSVGGSSGAAVLASAGLFPLQDVTGPGGSKMHLEYAYSSASATAPFTLDLTSASYNPHPTTANCYKNRVALGYTSTTANGLALLNSRFTAHLQKLAAIEVSAKADCASADTVVRRYQFNYQDNGDADTRLPRLQSVSVTGRAGTPEATTALPVATYTYGSATRGGAVVYTATRQLPAENLSVSGVASSSTPFTLPLGGNGYFSSNWLIDLNGDGRADHGGISEEVPGPFIQFLTGTGRRAYGIHALSATRYAADPVSTDRTWRQTIDFNGDGRLDVVDATEVQHAWVVYLNTPSPLGAGIVFWGRFVFNTDAINAELRAAGSWADVNYTPMGLRRTDRVGMETTTTLWKLMDVNGDGYPDLVFRAADNKVKVLLNVIGPQLLQSDVSAANRPFSAPVDYVTDDTCGIETWRMSTSDHPIQEQQCSLADVNGDGIVDRINALNVSLGVAQPMAHSALSDYFSTPMFTLPGMPRSRNLWNRACNGPRLPGTLVASEIEIAGLRDINGDGIPDFLRVNDNPALEVAFGTGLGFTSFVALEGAPPSSISVEHESCEVDFGRAAAGMADLNGDGKPEIFTPTAVLELLGSSGLAGAPDAGRLVQIDNGYGARTIIQYASAKADLTTLHQVPFPEIVVSSVRTTDTQGFGGALSEIRYAYGEAERYFDSYDDRFIFPGYRVTAALHLGDANAKPSATITTAYGLPFLSGTAITQNVRFGRYLKVGRTRDVYQLTDNPQVSGATLGTDPYALLLNFRADSGESLGSPDARIISRTHHEWDTRLLAAPAASNDPQFCWDINFPWDFEASKRVDTSQGNDANHANFDICLARGFVFEREVTTTRTALKPATPGEDYASANVGTRSQVLDIDDLGRVLHTRHWNDINVDDDDVCVETTYAIPVNTTNAKSVFGPATRKLTDCASTPVTLARESWEYDSLALGSISNGFVTGHNIERRNSAGELLATMRDFDSVWDTATGNPTSIVLRRNAAGDDGASRTTTVTYDPFGLVMRTLQTNATNGDGTSVPSLSVTRTLDPLTLNVLASTDPNGTVRTLTYDGFDRPLLAEITPPGGTLGVLSSMSYLGFGGGDSLGRRIVRKEFTDPVAPGSVASAAGRTSTTFLDELARIRKSELALGADYANQRLIVGARRYDGYGRALFEADPFPATQSLATAYGTTRYFSSDGTPSCFIRGNGFQPFTNVTDEAHELYPTCLRHTFENHQEVRDVRDPMALRPGDGSSGAMKRTLSTATGSAVSKETWQVTNQALTTRKEHSSFAHDRLGRLTTMNRFLRADLAADTPLTTVWKYDSLGQLIELDEPGAAAQTRTYSSWRELTRVSWCDTTTSPCTERRTDFRFDALGRLVHSDSRDDNVIDAATVNDYAYDQPATFLTRMQPRYVLGRLASASSPESRVALSYDAAGRTEGQGFDDRHGAEYLEKLTYHGDGSPLRFDLMLPDASYNDERVDYTYDSAGRTRSVRYADGTVTQDLFSAPGSTDIDAFGRIRRATYGAAIFTAMYADTGRRLPSSLKVSSPGEAQLQEPDPEQSREISFVTPEGATSAFDALGRERSRQEIKDGVAGAPIMAFDYSVLGELRSATRKVGSTLIAGAQFDYDSLGNLLRHSYAGAPLPGTVNMSYQAVDRDRICSVTFDGSTPPATCNVKYDGAGAITEMPTRSKGKRLLTYYADGRVKSITDGSLNIASFKYDAFGGVERLGVFSTSSPDTRHDWHFGAHVDKHDEVVNGVVQSVITRKIPAAGVLVTRHGATGNWTFAFGESRGNRFFTDQNGAFVQDVDYKPYGETLAAGSTGAQPGSPNYTSAQWNGGDSLAALGLSQLGARLYDPIIGRFLSRDPLFVSSRATKANPYAFAGNDPVNSADPTGLNGTDDDDKKCQCSGDGGLDNGNGSPGGGGESPGSGGDGDGDGDGGGGGGGGEGGGYPDAGGIAVVYIPSDDDGPSPSVGGGASIFPWEWSPGRPGGLHGGPRCPEGCTTGGGGGGGGPSGSDRGTGRSHGAGAHGFPISVGATYGAAERARDWRGLDEINDAELAAQEELGELTAEAGLSDREREALARALINAGDLARAVRVANLDWDWTQAANDPASPLHQYVAMAVLAHTVDPVAMAPGLPGGGGAAGRLPGALNKVENALITRLVRKYGLTRAQRGLVHREITRQGLELEGEAGIEAIVREIAGGKAGKR